MNVPCEGHIYSPPTRSLDRSIAHSIVPYRQCIVDGDCPSAAARCSDTQVCETCSDESDCVLCPPNQVCTPLFQEVDTAVGAGRRRLMTHNEISRLSCRMCSEAGLQCTENRPFCNFGTCVQVSIVDLTNGHRR